MTLDSLQIKRLAFIKFLYGSGLQFLALPQPQANTSLLLFHDAAELFLNLAVEVLSLEQPRDGSLIAYWKILDAHLSPQAVTRKDSMAALNRARVGLKHHGNTLDRLALETFGRTIEDFFKENSPTLFGVSFEGVSLIDLVFPEQAKEQLLAAQTFLSTGSHSEAAEGAALAFDTITSDYEMRKRDRFGRSPFFLGDRLQSLSNLSFITNSLGMHVGGSRSTDSATRLDVHKLSSFANSISSTVRALQSALRIIAFGLDFRKYSRFAYLTPQIVHNINGQPFVQNPRQPPGLTMTRDECTFCIDFVIESSLILQEFDYTRTIPPFTLSVGSP